MSEMIERVARAIFAKITDKAGFGFEHLPPSAQECYRTDARSAIMAMRNPTKQMFDNSMLYMDSWSSNTAWWQAMIDAALKD